MNLKGYNRKSMSPDPHILEDTYLSINSLFVSLSYGKRSDTVQLITVYAK